MDFTTNYCGPYWNDGKFQSSSKNPKRKPVNEWDETCYDHDLSYAFADNNISVLSKADQVFYDSNIGKGVKRTAAAYIVKYGNKYVRMLPDFYGFGLFGNVIHRPKEDPTKNNVINQQQPVVEETHSYCPAGTFIPELPGVDKPYRVVSQLVTAGKGASPVMNIEKPAKIKYSPTDNFVQDVESNNYSTMRSKRTVQNINMVSKKNNNKMKNNKNKKKSKNPPKRKQASARPVSTIHTAPVTMGNSVRGSKPHVTNIANGVRVVGRDFAISLSSTASTVTGWSLIGGMPLTPAVLPSTILRNYTQSYAKFKINKVLVHYITSSPTSTAGDIMFYYERDRKSPMCDFTSSSFLPYVLSDSNTIIGPQWTNHSLLIKPTDSFNGTNYGMNADLNEDSCGSIFVFSKTNATNSPGYILIDYDITFKELCVNPRAGILPIARGQWNQMTVGLSAGAVTAGTTVMSVSLLGKDLSNSNTTAVTGILTGDIYKVIFDVTNSQILNTWTNCTPSNLLNIYNGYTVTAATIDDGFTCYALYANSQFQYFTTYEAALTTAVQMRFGVTATITFGLIGWYSLVGSTNSQLQSSY